MRAKEFIFEAAEYYDYAKKMSEKYGVPYSVVKHALTKETGHISDPNKRARAVSPVGAGGVMQLMPKTAKSLGVKDRFDPYQNIEGGVKYLSQLYKKYNDPVLALAAYNAGPGNVNKYGGVPPFKETRKYVSGYEHEEPESTSKQPPKEPNYKDAFKNVGSTLVSQNDIKSQAIKVGTAALGALVGAQPAQAIELPKPEKIKPIVTPSKSIDDLSPEETARQEKRMADIGDQWKREKEETARQEKRMADIGDQWKREKELKK